MSIKIHGKDYFTVAERLTEARESLQSISTEILPNGGSVVVKATVTLKSGQVFTGISAANPSKAIEKMSPYEVAETSAVGRALGFAGFGAVDSIASADEMAKSSTEDVTGEWPQVKNKTSEEVKKVEGKPCPECNVGTIVLNPKKGTLFCDKMCWLNK